MKTPVSVAVHARWAACAALGALLAGCGGGRTSDAGADTSWREDTDASAPIAIPVVSGEFVRVMTPDRGRYLNDHTVVFDPA